MTDTIESLERTIRPRLASGLAPRLATAAVALVLVASLMPDLSNAAQVVARHADWTAYAHDGDGQKLCFVVSEPKDKQPTGAKRDAPHFYVTGWPKAGIKSEVSIKMGYAVKKGSEPVVTVDNQVFRLFASADRLFVADPTEELKLIEAMKKGQRLFVQATSERGTSTMDTYSLAGLTQALQAAAASCP